MKKFFTGIGKILQLIFGLAFIVGGIVELAKDTSRFLSADATVVSTVETYGAGDSHTDYQIDYEYRVDGTTYTGSYESPVDRAKGDVFTVYYDPRSPSESYQSQRQTITWGLAGLAFGLYAAGDVIWGAWKKRSAKKAGQAIPGQEPD